MMGIWTWAFIVFYCIVKSRISADSQLDCGCEFKDLFESQILADCSNKKIINFKCLEEINPHKILLGNNNYKEVPAELFELRFTETQHIDFSENSIEHLPEGLLSIFPNLQSANFSHNNLTNPMEIFRIDGEELTILIDHNEFSCNCSDPDITKLRSHQEVCNPFITST